MAVVLRCEPCGAENTPSTPDGQARTVCEQCGAALARTREDAATVSFGDEQIPETSPVDSEALTALWRDSIATGATPDQTLKDRPPSSNRTSRLVVKPHAVTSGFADPSAPADYELLEVLGEGGMGVVYAARQTSVDRTIAVKMIRPEVTTNDAQRSGFLTEAAITGELEHPNIVPVYELGANAEGQLFYAMRRVKGVRWSRALAERSQAENLDILMHVADAVAFAHSKGVIHRDIKPDNVMLGDFGEVLLIDWGLAASANRDGRPEGLEQTAQAGTPAYMAPEMARGLLRQIGFASDVYLLGAALYTLVTGRPPHGGKQTMEVVIAAARNRITRTDKKGELVEIALKAMATDPTDRYPSVKDFQAAIREYQAHSESVVLSTRAAEHLDRARRTGEYADYRRALAVFEEALALWPENGTAERGQKDARLAYAQCASGHGDYDLAESLLLRDETDHAALLEEVARARRQRERRRKRLRALTYASASLVFIVLIVLTAAYVLVSAEQSKTKSALLGERAALQQAQYQRGKALVARDDAQREKARALEARDRAVSAEKQTAAKHRELLRESYAVKASLAHQRILNGAMGNAEALLDSCPTEFRGWEWGHMKGLCHQEATSRHVGGYAYAVDVTSDGKRFACGDGNGRIIIGRVEGLIETHRFQGHPRKVAYVEFSPDGASLATTSTDGTVRVWNSDTGRARLEPTRHGMRLIRATWSPDGNRLLSASRSGMFICWDAKTGEVLSRWSRPTSVVFVGWRPDGQGCVAVGRRSGDAGVWIENVSEPARQLPDLKGVPTALFAAMDAARHRLMVGDHMRGASLIEIATGKVLLTTDTAGGAVPMSIAFSPNGERIAIGASSGLIVILDARTGERIFRLRGHRRGVQGVVFTPDGLSLLSVAKDRCLKSWDLRPFARGLLDTRPRKGLGAVAVSPDSKQCVFGGGKALRGRSLHDGSKGLDAELAGWVICLTMGPRGTRLAVGFADGRVQVHEATTGRLIRKLKDEGPYGKAIAYSPAGEYIASGDRGGTVRLWNAKTGERLAVSRPPPGTGKVRHDVRSLAFAPDGRRLAVARLNASPTLLSVPRLEVVSTLTDGPGVSCERVAFSPDGKRLLAAGYAPQICVYDLATGHQILRLLGHASRPTAIAYHPDGTRLFSGDVTGRVIVWDIGKGRELMRWQAHGGPVTQMAFTPDGKILVTTGGMDGAIRLWRAAPWRTPSKGGPAH